MQQSFHGLSDHRPRPAGFRAEGHRGAHLSDDKRSSRGVLDVLPDMSPEALEAEARSLLPDELDDDPGVLVMTDVFGATPSNIAQRLVDGNPGARARRRQRADAVAHAELCRPSTAGRAVRPCGPGRCAGRPDRLDPAAEPGFFFPVPMIKTTITISNRLGLYARPSAKLSKLAGSFPCDVFISTATVAASMPRASWA